MLTGLLRMSVSDVSRFCFVLVVLLLWGGGAGSAVSVARADAYLDALQEAADDIEVDPLSTGGSRRPATVEPRATAPRVTPQVQGDIPRGLDLAGLESFLKQGFVGSYAFFKRLSDEQKRKVFAAYESRPEIAYVRDQIKQQYLAR